MREWAPHSDFGIHLYPKGEALYVIGIWSGDEDRLTLAEVVAELP